MVKQWQVIQFLCMDPDIAVAVFAEAKELLTGKETEGFR